MARADLYIGSTLSLPYNSHTKSKGSLNEGSTQGRVREREEHNAPTTAYNEYWSVEGWRGSTEVEETLPRERLLVPSFRSRDMSFLFLEFPLPCVGISESRV